MAKRRTLNTNAVVRRAVEILNAHGDPERLSLAEVAESLDVKPPSLYNHVAGLDGLRQAIRVYAWQHLAQRLRGAVGHRTGRRALIELAYAYRSFAQDNPGLYRMVLPTHVDDEEPESTVAAEDIMTTLTLVFASVGLSGDDAIHAIRGYRSLLHGFVSLENSGGFAMPHEVEKSFHRAIGLYVDGVLAGVNGTQAAARHR